MLNLSRKINIYSACSQTNCVKNTKKMRFLGQNVRGSLFATIKKISSKIANIVAVLTSIVAVLTSIDVVLTSIDVVLTLYAVFLPFIRYLTTF